MSELIRIIINNKTFYSTNGKVEVFSKIDFSIEEGEFVSIVGQSGCGKSTLLRIIAGLEKDFEGSVVSKKMDSAVSFVFQDLGLFPWMTVKDNIKFANPDPNEVDILLKNINLFDYKNSWIKELSGGMKQRLAIARGLVNKPKLLLLDEPLRELDMISKEQLQNEIKELLTLNKTTTILVTHDIEEAIFFSTRIIVLSSKPACIKKIFSVNLDTMDRAAAAFQNLKADIKKELF